MFLQSKSFFWRSLGRRWRGAWRAMSFFGLGRPSQREQALEGENEELRREIVRLQVRAPLREKKRLLVVCCAWCDGTQRARA